MSKTDDEKSTDGGRGPMAGRTKRGSEGKEASKATSSAGRRCGGQRGKQSRVLRVGVAVASEWAERVEKAVEMRGVAGDTELR